LLSALTIDPVIFSLQAAQITFFLSMGVSFWLLVLVFSAGAGAGAWLTGAGADVGADVGGGGAGVCLVGTGVATGAGAGAGAGIGADVGGGGAGVCLAGTGVSTGAEAGGGAGAAAGAGAGVATGTGVASGAVMEEWPSVDVCLVKSDVCDFWGARGFDLGARGLENNDELLPILERDALKLLMLLDNCWTSLYILSFCVFSFLFWST